MDGIGFFCHSKALCLLKRSGQAALSRQVSKVSASIQPQLTAALAGDAGQTIYNGPEKIELVTNRDGREIARTSVPYIDAYLGNMAARKARGGV